MTTLFRFKSKRKAKVSHGLDDDPFSTRPFPDESEEDNRQRMWALQEATRISREIDQSLLEAKKLLDKKKKATKILLLGRPLLTSVDPCSYIASKGQSESGKVRFTILFQSIVTIANRYPIEFTIEKLVCFLEHAPGRLIPPRFPVGICSK